MKTHHGTAVLAVVALLVLAPASGVAQSADGRDDQNATRPLELTSSFHENYAVTKGYPADTANRSAVDGSHGRIYGYAVAGPGLAAAGAGGFTVFATDFEANASGRRTVRSTYTIDHLRYWGERSQVLVAEPKVGADFNAQIVVIDTTDGHDVVKSKTIPVVNVVSPSLEQAAVENFVDLLLDIGSGAIAKLFPSGYLKSTAIGLVGGEAVPEPFPNGFNELVRDERRTAAISFDAEKGHTYEVRLAFAASVTSVAVLTAGSESEITARTTVENFTLETPAADGTTPPANVRRTTQRGDTGETTQPGDTGETTQPGDAAETRRTTEFDGTKTTRSGSAGVTTRSGGDRQTTQPSEGTSTSGDGGDAVGRSSDRTLELLSTADNQFEYEVVVAGSAEPSATERVSADDSDRIVANGDGTVTIAGSTGDNAGDAFTVSGTVRSVEIRGVDSGYRVELDGRDVTDRVTVANGGHGSTSHAPDPVDSCTVITAPGRYELTRDVRGSEGVCIHVRSSDVVLDGNGHSVTGNGVADSVGVLVYNASRRESVDRGDTLSNVTVRNVTVSRWDDAVQVGDMAGIGTRATLVDVAAENNENTGIYLVESEDSSLRDVAATGNKFGVVLWETYDVTADGVTARGNDKIGLYLAQNVGDGTFTDVETRGNGGYGIRLSDDVEDNTIADSSIVDNGRAGISFADSTSNVVESAVVRSNDGPGILLSPGRGEEIRNATVRGNAGPAIEVAEGELGSADLTVGTAARVRVPAQSVDFGADTPFSLRAVPVGNLSGDVPGDPVVEEALDVTGPRSPLRVSFDYDAEDAANVSLWRYSGGEWTRVSDATVTGSTVTGQVATSGVVLPVATGEAGADDTEGGQSGTGRTETGGSDRITVQGDAVEIRSTEENQFAYRLVVDGTAEPTVTDGISADEEDVVAENGDGTVTIAGSTGGNAGDAFTVTGTIVTAEIVGVDSGYRLEVDDEDFTDRVVASAGDEPPSIGAAEASTLAIRSTAENQFVYQVVVDGTAEPTVAGGIAADEEDIVGGNGDGTVIVVGSTGGNAGDVFEFTGAVRSVRIIGVDSGYRIEVDGEDVTESVVENG